MCERCEHLEYLLEELTTIPPEMAGHLDNLPLTAGQKRVLGAMLGNEGKPMKRSQLLAAVRVDRPYSDWSQDDVVDAHICNIRKKLGPDSPIKIRTHWGIGYSATVREPVA